MPKGGQDSAAVDILNGSRYGRFHLGERTSDLTSIIVTASVNNSNRTTSWEAPSLGLITFGSLRQSECSRED
jgi:hypothetical protein